MLRSYEVHESRASEGAQRGKKHESKVRRGVPNMCARNLQKITPSTESERGPVSYHIKATKASACTCVRIMLLS